MKTMESLDEFAVSFDIVSRLAIAAFAQTHSTEEVGLVFQSIRNALVEGYDEAIPVVEIADNFQQAVLRYRGEA